VQERTAEVYLVQIECSVRMHHENTAAHTSCRKHTQCRYTAANAVHESTDATYSIGSTPTYVSTPHNVDTTAPHNLIAALDQQTQATSDHANVPAASPASCQLPFVLTPGNVDHPPHTTDCSCTRPTNTSNIRTHTFANRNKQHCSKHLCQ
jgi:hypothetical protein